ncbi:MAG: hypothetical protein PHC48_08960 [Prevotella sp.]|jgi:hypothetical protein|nr:hypothetical protein [Prevotella sp.]
MNKIHLLIILFLSCVGLTAQAQYYSVNYDKKTVAAMATAYNTEAATEAYYNEQVQNILKHYNAAEVATAGIFASKFLDRKALTELGVWSSSTENYYYRRIYNMVSRKIMPTIWTVAGMMLKSPQTALYWGSYLVKICDDTKSLCMQFESVVTNSSLTFSDIAFLQIKEEIASILKLSEIGNVDWQRMLDDLSKVPGNFTVDNLKADIDNLYKTGVNLASAGVSNIGDAFLQSSQFHDLINGKLGAAVNIVDNYSTLFEQLDKSVGNTLLGMVGGKDNVAGLFNFANYNLTSWMTDYLSEKAGNYYTQRWYIARRDQGSETLCDYYPPTDDNSVIYGGEWTRFDTSDSNFSPNSAQREQILSNSERYAGWSRSRVDMLNKQNDGFTYYINYYLKGYIISRGGRQTQKSYAYEIHVSKYWNHVEEVYEEVFDSYSMDLNTFKAQLNARLSEFNDNEEGYTYYIGSDSRNYYQATDAGKLKGCESVTISVTCSDGVSLGSGSTQYKCRECGGSLNAHSKECAMRTTISENDNSMAELEQLEAEYKAQIEQFKSEITSLEADNQRLIIQMHQNPNLGPYNVKLIEANNVKIAQLKKDLADVQQKLADVEQAKADAAEDNAVATDDYYRIPAIMQDCKTAYNLTWQGPGTWEGYTYVRKATMPNINGVITFKATLSIVRKPKYFLGIKIHRAILQISWELTSEYTSTSVVEVMTLAPSKSDKEKADEVNKRISEIAQEYPSCKITTEYAKSAPTENDATPDTYHLLWQSDRLEIARQVDSRITKIYADLVSLEKMMHYKRSIIDVLKSVAPHINDDQGRRLTLVEECRKRWLRKAANSMHSDSYNGKYDEEE